MTLPAGRYTAHLRSEGAEGGTGLIEVYETSDIGAVLNLSVRGAAHGSSDPLVAGFVVEGDAPKRVLLRAIGPTLADFAVEGVLSDPKLVLRTHTEFVAENDDWADAENKDAVIAASTYVGAFALEEGSADAVLLITLPPGLYTAAVEGKDGAEGAALVEVYEIR